MDIHTVSLGDIILPTPLDVKEMHDAHDIYAMTGYSDHRRSYRGDGIPRIRQIGDAWELWFMVRQADDQVVFTRRVLPIDDNFVAVRKILLDVFKTYRSTFNRACSIKRKLS